MLRLGDQSGGHYCCRLELSGSPVPVLELPQLLYDPEKTLITFLGHVGGGHED